VKLDAHHTRMQGRQWHTMVNFLDITHRIIFIPKDVSETGFSLLLQLERLLCWVQSIEQVHISKTQLRIPPHELNIFQVSFSVLKSIPVRLPLALAC
jgi:hypothetical protein